MSTVAMAEEKDAELAANERIRWRDEEQGRGRALSRRRMSRGTSADSMAIRSIHSRREVDPAITLPIQYRTV